MASLSSCNTDSFLSNTADKHGYIERKRSLSNNFNSLTLSHTKTLSELIAICPSEYTQKTIVNSTTLTQQFHRIYIFDFDNTIFPTSIIQKNLQIWNHTELSTIHEYKQCHYLYTAIKNCIEYVLNLYTNIITKYKQNINFVIITNASNNWIKEIKTNHSSLVGQLIVKLQSHIPIISAKDQFVETYNDWYSEYSIIAKQDAFVKYIKTLNITNKIPVIYCVGDSECEHQAAQLTVDTLYKRAEKRQKHLYLLYRIQLRTNRKSKYQKFKLLDKFYDTLKKTEGYLFDSDESLNKILTILCVNEKKGLNESNEQIIDYKL